MLPSPWLTPRRPLPRAHTPSPPPRSHAHTTAHARPTVPSHPPWTQGGEGVALARLQYYLWDSDLLATYFDTRNGMLGGGWAGRGARGGHGEGGPGGQRDVLGACVSCGSRASGARRAGGRRTAGGGAGAGQGGGASAPAVPAGKGCCTPGWHSPPPWEQAGRGIVQVGVCHSQVKQYANQCCSCCRTLALLLLPPPPPLASFSRPPCR